MQVLRLINMIDGVEVSPLNNYAQHVHHLNYKWWFDKNGVELKRDPYERLMLATSEVAEAMEGYRKSLQDDHLPQYPMVWVELADFVIRLLDMSGAFGWNITYGKVDYIPIRDMKNIPSRLFMLQDFTTRIGWSTDESDPRTWLRGELVWHCIKQSELISLELGCLDFWEVVYDKLSYNLTRHDHSYEAREAPQGKKF